MHTAAPEEMLGFLIADIQRMMRPALESRLKAFGITRTQAHVLVAISRNEGIKPSTLAQRMDVQNITVTRLVDKLVQRDLVERQSDPKDRRTRRLFLTSRARGVVQTVWDAIDSISRDSLVELTAPEQRALLTGLGKVRRRLARKNGEKR